ncbi:MAG: molecular chaperone HtpG, partial [Fusobacteriaceae bacterium]
IQDMFGMNKEKLQNLLIFKSSKEEKYITLKEYIDAMPSEQKDIYYVAGDDIEILKSHPKMKSIKDKGFDILFLLDKIDEFSIKTLMEYEKKKFKSINDSDLEIDESAKEKEKKKELQEENKSLIEKIQGVLGDKIKEVKLSSSLGDSAVSISSKGSVSLEMEKTLSQMPGNENVKAEKVLELNVDHPVFKKLQRSVDDEEIKALSEILFEEGMLIEGFQIKNPVEFVAKVNKFIK